MRLWINDRRRVLGPLLILAGLLLVPWLLHLSFTLPRSTRARNWSLMWTGVDLAEALGLVATGVLQWRRSPRRAIPAAFTSALLAVDAWVDVTTSAPGQAKVLAVVLAAALEVPAAIACLVLAFSTFPLGDHPNVTPPGARGPAQAVHGDEVGTPDQQVDPRSGITPPHGRNRSRSN